MEDNDTIRLLRECDAGTQMAVASIDEVLDKVRSETVRQMLSKSKDNHEKLGSEIKSLLAQSGEDGKSPNPVAKGMSWIKTNVKMGVDESDKTVADLMTDGCNMGVKSLHKYLNKYKAADDESRSLCKGLIQIEQQLGSDLSAYL